MFALNSLEPSPPKGTSPPTGPVSPGKTRMVWFDGTPPAENQGNIRKAKKEHRIHEQTGTHLAPFPCRSCAC